jgi:hypothetical protein
MKKGGRESLIRGASAIRFFVLVSALERRGAEKRGRDEKEQ